MKILLELFSSIWLSTSLVRNVITSRIYHYVIVSAIFSLLFQQCIAKRINHNSAEIQKQLNDGISSLPTATHATHITNLLLESTRVKSQSTNYIKRSGKTNSPAFRTLTSTSIDPLQSSKSTFFSQPFIESSRTTYSSNAAVSQSNGKPTYSNNVLVLIQTKNIKINFVRDQFHQFSDMFGVKLQNLTIDFDSIDGKLNLLFYTNI